jgi:HlyD family secretion protein
LLVLPLAAFACQRRHASPLYQIVPVAHRDLASLASGQGTIQPIDSVNIRSRTAGEVTQLLVSEGDEVHRNEKLIQIDERIPRANLQTADAQLAVARATLTTAQQQLNRATELYHSQSITQQEFDSISLVRDNAAAAVVSAQTARDDARIALENAGIEAPSAGVVLAVRVNRGTVIPSTTFSVDSTALLTIADIDTVKAVIWVSETQIAQLHDSMLAVVTVDAYPDTAFTGTIDKIEPLSVVQNQETDFPVQVILPNRSHLLKPGMNAEISIETAERHDVLAVPYASLRTREDVRSGAELLGIPADTLGRSPRARGDSARRQSRAGPRTGDSTRTTPRRRNGNQYYVFTKENGDIRIVPIRTGLTDRDWAEVQTGLGDRDTVLVLPSQSLVKNIQDLQARTQRAAGLPGMGSAPRR